MKTCSSSRKRILVQMDERMLADTPGATEIVVSVAELQSWGFGFDGRQEHASCAVAHSVNSNCIKVKNIPLSSFGGGGGGGERACMICCIYIQIMALVVRCDYPVQEYKESDA